jgi:peptidoglycan lytic transglycosylase F
VGVTQGGRRALLTLCGLALARAALAAAAGDPTDLPAIRSRGSLRVLSAVTPLNQFFSLSPGEEPGFDREILELFARLHEVRVEAVAAPSWDRLIPFLIEGRGDCIAGGFSHTPVRARSIAFTDAVFPSRHVVVTRKPQPPVQTLEELRKRKFGVIKGTSALEILLAAGVPRDRIEDLPPGVQMQDALRSGRTTAHVIGVERALIYTRDDAELEIGMTVGPPDELAWGVRKEDVQLRAALNAFLTNFRRTPSWNRLIVKYFGPAAPRILQVAKPE